MNISTQPCFNDLAYMFPGLSVRWPGPVPSLCNYSLGQSHCYAIILLYLL